MLYISRYYIIFTSTLILGSVGIIPSVFADTFQVSIIPGSGPSDYCSETATCFTPSILNISPGDTIMWTNNDNVDHTVVSGLPYAKQIGTIFDSGAIAPGKTYSFTFYNAGTYKYSDKIDKWMVGEVNVRPSQPSSAVPEFGYITMLVLAISIISTIVVSTKIQVL
ncbi:MAG TPA: PEFG-CTERM sorting domain-containing protein [Nitrosopumilaceae archaeon]|nr:PEFG-CTERM sorting domain-containing protein [Nitrosopumilaceae archaeon]